jgi:EcsC protein family
MTNTTEPGRPASALVTVLYWAYDQATAALPGIGSAEDLAERHRVRCGGLEEPAIDDLIKWQVRYAGAAGFVTNLGGLAAMPVTVPANLASVLLLQLRMIAAIAILRGYQPNDPRVRTLAFLCLMGSAAADVLQELSVGLGTRLSTGLILRLSAGSLGKINQAVVARLAGRMGASGLAGLGRLVPLVGGLVGGGFDAMVTRGIGTAAKMAFGASPADVIPGSAVTLVEGAPSDARTDV